MEKKENNRLTSLDLAVTEFVANGKLYFIEPEISVERFQKMQEIEIELAYGVSYKKMFEGLKECYEYLNDQQFADAAVFLHNLMNSIGKLEERESPIMEYCTMFINTADEDRKVVDEKVMSNKLEDWKKEGINYHSFFLLAVNMVRGLKENYLEFIQSTSTSEAK